MKKGLVFCGGGSKGAYQMGAWQALEELNEKFDIVTGTSIGCLNGAMFTQHDYQKNVMKYGILLMLIK
ncbi:MAG: patatin-like phospholipase family protein [Clostridium sp.]|nr:MAG: patatin-like phospholipase family protein [Clostridium sp.]